MFNSKTGGTGRRGMTTLFVASPLYVVLLFILNVFCSAGETKIPAEPGQNVVLPCRAENIPVIVLEWSRTDLGEYEHVALYQDDQFNYHSQHPAYRNRVDLQDKEMKDGNVSLVMKNVTTNDSGTYECRVVQRGRERRKRSHLDTGPICIINLILAPEGNKDGRKEDEGKEDGGKKDGGTNTGLIVGVPVSVGLVLLGGGVVGFLFYKRQRCSSQEQNPPPSAETELQPMNPENC